MIILGHNYALTPSPLSWLKVNTDGMSTGNWVWLAASAGVFRNSLGSFIGGFFHPLRVQTSFM